MYEFVVVVKDANGKSETLYLAADDIKEIWSMIPSLVEDLDMTEIVWLLIRRTKMVEHNSTFTKETLYTQHGDEVVTVAVPTMKPKPEIICWGSRYFVLGLLSGKAHYVEGIIWHIGSGQEIQPDSMPDPNDVSNPTR